MYTKICTRSGLVFTTDNNRLKVHPEISKWTTLKDTDIRYTAISVIEQGKMEQWNSISKFNSEIEKAIKPVKKESNYQTSDYANRKGWIALIEGQDLQYGYSRKFVNAVDQDGKRKKYLIKEDGVYQSVSYSSSGNKSEVWLEVVQGVIQQITNEQAIEIVGLPSEKIQSKDELTKVLEECWECGAQYSTYGNVEGGNMSCIRCR
jgi:hypothetical protein